MNEVAGQEAAPKARRQPPTDATPRGARHALPDPLRQHRFYRDGHHEIEGEKRQSFGGKQGERQDAEMVAVVGEDEAVEHEEAENDTAEENGDGQDEARPRKP